MRKLHFLAILLFIFLGCGAITGLSQTSPNEIFVTTYDTQGDVSVNLDGQNGISGVAVVERKSYLKTEITLDIKNLPPVTKFGNEFTTFVLWAVMLDGSTLNLHTIDSKELVRNEKVRVEPRLQSFGMLLTAEPHTLVRRPSTKVAFKTAALTGVMGQLDRSKLVRFQFDTSICIKAPETIETPGTKKKEVPFILLGARLAVRRARCEEAENYAETAAILSEAVVNLVFAENTWLGKGSESQIELYSIRATELATKAELLVEKAREDKISHDKIENEKNILRARIKKLEQDITELKIDKNDAAQAYETDIQEIKDKSRKTSEATAAEINKLRNELSVLQKAKARLELKYKLRAFESVTDDGKTLKITWKENLPNNLQLADLTPRQIETLNSVLEVTKENKKVRMTIELDYSGIANVDRWQKISADRFVNFEKSVTGFGLTTDRWKMPQIIFNVRPPSVKEKPTEIVETIMIVLELGETIDSK